MTSADVRLISGTVILFSPKSHILELKKKKREMETGNYAIFYLK